MMTQQVLDLMKEVCSVEGREDEERVEMSSDVSGYHSDSDSAVMASGNSPFLSKSARYNFLSRSGEFLFVRSFAVTQECRVS